jgi:hypothetical protein
MKHQHYFMTKMLLLFGMRGDMGGNVILSGRQRSPCSSHVSSSLKEV